MSHIADNVEEDGQGIVCLVIIGMQIIGNLLYKCSAKEKEAMGVDCLCDAAQYIAGDIQSQMSYLRILCTHRTERDDSAVTYQTESYIFTSNSNTMHG